MTWRAARVCVPWEALLLLACGACKTASAEPPHPPSLAPGIASSAVPEEPPGPRGEASLQRRQARIVARAREEVARGVVYDPAYVRLTFRGGVDTGHAVYPAGDLDPSRGVCTDVVVRGLRAAGVDLQERIHADILGHPDAYPSVSTPDANIDHRRVGPLLTYLRAHALTVGDGDWQAGDIVVWAFAKCPRCNPDHVGVVSDKPGASGHPLVIHNLGPSPSEDDILGAWPRLGHFRL